MRKTSIEFLAKTCNGKVLGDKTQLVQDIQIDSRSAFAGDLFVCVVGENNDGHKFAAAAYNNGCRYFLMSDSAIAEETAKKEDAVIILTEDTIKAFEQMAESYLNQFNVKRLAVSGSVGKTTTKMLTAAVLSAKYKTICTKKNLNTNLGLCLTCFLADESTEAIVFEMGMDAKGQISEYVSFIKPELAILTNIGISHMERLGSRDAIADAKLEITEQFNESNTLVVNANSDYLKTEEEIRTRADNKSNYSIVKVIPSTEITNKGFDGVNFVYQNNEYYLPLIGEHNVLDACLAIEAGKVMGIGPKEAAEGLSKVESTERRMKAEKIKGFTLIDDSYNASPDSMTAAIKALAAAEGKRKIALLSDMFELGDAEEEGHFNVGRTVAECGIDMLIAVGENSNLYIQGVHSVSGASVTTIELGTNISALNMALQILKDGDVILIKGSNGTYVSQVAEGIREANK